MSETSSNRKSGQKSFYLPEDRLYLATRAWVMWLQGLFLSRPLGYLKWDPNPTETEIIISDSLPTSTQITNKRPIITTTRSSAQFTGASRDQVLHRNFDGDKFILSDIIGTGMTFSCVAREGIEAQEIAYSIFRMIPVFKPSIMRLGRLHHISNNITVGPETQHGAVVPGSSFPEWRMVQVSVPFSIQDVISVGFSSKEINSLGFGGSGGSGSEGSSQNQSTSQRNSDTPEEEGEGAFHNMLRAVNLYMQTGDTTQVVLADER